MNLNISDTVTSTKFIHNHKPFAIVQNFIVIAVVYLIEDTQSFPIMYSNLESNLIHLTLILDYKNLLFLLIDHHT